MLLGTASDPRGISLFYLVRLPNWEHPGDGVDTLGPVPVTMASSGATLTPWCQTFPKPRVLKTVNMDACLHVVCNRRMSLEQRHG